MCGICSAGCAVQVHLEAGRIRKLTPLGGHPNGFVCPRGARAPDIVYSPDRLLHPLVRTAARGDTEPAFARIGWGAAYDRMVDGLRRVAYRYGPEAVGIYSGTGNFDFGMNEHFAPAGTVESSANAVLFPFGSPNASGVGALCYASFGMIATRACFGAPYREMQADLDGAELILIWGANPATDSPPLRLRQVRRALERGASVITIDHRRSETARVLGCPWIGVRPGTDGALALGMIREIIEEDLYNHAFVRDWTHGFEELRAYARSFTPEWVAAITRVPAGEVRTLARRIASARGCCFVTYSGLEYSNSGVQAIRAVWCLLALCGHLDTPGSNQFKMRARPRLNRLMTGPPAGARPALGAQRYPLFFESRREAQAVEFPRAILEGDPYPLRALIVTGASLLTSWPQPELWRRALQALDLLVVVNRFPSADSRYADLVLPACTGFETESYQIYDGSLVQLRQRVIPPLGESRPDYLIFAELARRLGYGHLWPQTEKDMVRHALEGTGITLEDLRAHPEGIRLPHPPMRHRKYASGHLRLDGRPGFETPTGKFELASTWLADHGYDTLPVYREPAEGPLSTPELAARYPLVFNSGARTRITSHHTRHHHVRSIAARQPWPLVFIHPDDAAPRGIADGDRVDVVSARGRVPFRAHVTPNILAGTIEANGGGGGPIGPKAWRDANVNELTDYHNRDPVSGFPVYKALLCDLERSGPARRKPEDGAVRPTPPPGPGPQRESESHG